MKDVYSLIEVLIHQNEWVRVLQVIDQELEDNPSDHWLLARKALVYYEEYRNYQEALKWAKKALDIAPHCPLAIWEYAGALDMLGQEETACYCYLRLLEECLSMRFGQSTNECNEGKHWNRKLFVDVCKRLSQSYQDLDEKLSNPETS